MNVPSLLVAFGAVALLPVVLLCGGRVTMDVQDALTPVDRARGLVLACQARPTCDVVIDA